MSAPASSSVSELSSAVTPQHAQLLREPSDVEIGTWARRQKHFLGGAPLSEMPHCHHLFISFFPTVSLGNVSFVIMRLK